MPSARKSILMKRASSQESLSHWQMSGPAIAAGWTGTSSISGRRGDDHPADVLADVAREAGDLLGQLDQVAPERRRRPGPANSGSRASSSPHAPAEWRSASLASWSSSPGGRPSALPRSRTALRRW